MSKDDTTIDKRTVAKMSVDKTTVANMSIHEMVIG
jgi:hypothetical protein